MTKYAPLTEFLQQQPVNRLPVTFAELESLLGFALPPSARKHRAWWANNPASHVNAAAWHEAGFQSQEVDMEGEKLMFVKLNSNDQAPRKRDHPLFGCMKGMIWIDPTLDLTAPIYTDEEMDEFIDAKFRLINSLPR